MSAAITATAVQGPATASTAIAKPHAGLSFGDLLDVINPLQHIPVISTIYRRITGDKMSPTAEIAGGALYGGIIGTIASIADVLFTEETGKDFGETVFAWLGFKRHDATQLATTGDKVKPASTPVATTAPRVILPRAVTTSANAPHAFSRPASLASKPSPQARGEGVIAVPGLPSLIDALQKQGVDPAVAARAALAYRSTIGWQREQNPSAASAY